MAVRNITPLPQPPTSTDPLNFRVRADEFMSALPVFSNEMNEAIDQFNVDFSLSYQYKVDAENARDIAVGAVNFKGEYQIGTTYNVGESVVYNGLRFLAKTQTSAEPVDGTDWYLLDNKVVIEDLSTGKKYRLFIDNGNLGLEEV